MENNTFYNLAWIDFQKATFCAFKSTPLPWKSTLFPSWPGAGPGTDLGWPLLILDSSVKRHARLQYRFSLPGKSILLYLSFTYAFNRDSNFYLRSTLVFLLIINIFQEKLLGWPQFLSKSGFFCVAQFWTLGNGRGLPSWAELKVQAYDSLENALCLCQSNVFYKKSFFWI